MLSTHLSVADTVQQFHWEEGHLRGEFADVTLGGCTLVTRQCVEEVHDAHTFSSESVVQITSFHPATTVKLRRLTGWELREREAHSLDSLSNQFVCRKATGSTPMPTILTVQTLLDKATSKGNNSIQYSE
jgi:hypothetical protein